MSRPDAEADYDMFVAVAAATGTVWSLWQGGWASFDGEAGRQGLPLWSSAEQVEDWKRENAPDWEAMPLDLDWLLDDILPNIGKENGSVILFQASGEADWVAPAQLAADLRETLDGDA